MNSPLRPDPNAGRESLTDRKIREAREQGMFDDLVGAGEPIADLDRQRPPGWWANRFLKQERSKLKLAALDERLTRERARLWRLATEAEVRARVVELNRVIADYNTVSNLEPREALDANEMVATWRRLGLANR